MNLVHTWQNPYLTPQQNLLYACTILNQSRRPGAQIRNDYKTYKHTVNILGEEKVIEQKVMETKYY